MAQNPYKVLQKSGILIQRISKVHFLVFWGGSGDLEHLAKFYAPWSGTDAAWSAKVWHAGSAAQFAFSVPGLLGCVFCAIHAL